MCEPYPVCEEQNGDILFTIKEQVSYRVYFEGGLPSLITDPTLSELVTEFTFLPARGFEAIGALDCRIMATVAQLVRRYLSGFPNEVLFYTCMDGDGREYKRFLGFQRQFERCNDNGWLTIRPYMLAVSGRLKYGAVLFVTGHPRTADIIACLSKTLSYHEASPSKNWGL